MDLSRDQFGGSRHPLRVKPEGVYANERPGTQGQMVTGGHEQPWPRGYSPERRREVEAALADTTIVGMPDTPSYHRAHDRWTKAYRESGEDFEKAGYFPDRYHEIGKKQSRARVVKDVAASTVPTEDLAGLHGIHVSQDSYADALGTYEVAGSYSGEPVINLYPGAGQRTTVHEIGHHASNLAGNEHAAGRGYARSASARGREEAFADDYASRHVKGDDDRSAYEYGAVAHSRGWGSDEDFRKAYVGKRSALSGQQFQPPEGSLLPAPQPEEPEDAGPGGEPIHGRTRQPSFSELVKHQQAEEEGVLPTGEAGFLGDWRRFSGMEPHHQDEYLGAQRVLKSHLEGKIPPIIGTRQMEAQTMSPFHRNRPRP